MLAVCLEEPSLLCSHLDCTGKYENFPSCTVSSMVAGTSVGIDATPPPEAMALVLPHCLQHLASDVGIGLNSAEQIIIYDCIKNY